MAKKVVTGVLILLFINLSIGVSYGEAKKTLYTYDFSENFERPEPDYKPVFITAGILILIGASWYLTKSGTWPASPQDTDDKGTNGSDDGTIYQDNGHQNESEADNPEMHFEEGERHDTFLQDILESKQIVLVRW